MVAAAVRTTTQLAATAEPHALGVSLSMPPSNHVEHAQLARDVDHHGQRRHKCENGREAGGEGGGGRRLDGCERHAAGNQDS